MTKETTATQLKMKDLTRRQIRYICFRLQTEAEGGNKALTEKTGVMSLVGKVKAHMESQDDFGGWKMFAKTWDVDEKSPLVVVKRTSSIYTDWNNVLKKGAKDFPQVAQTTKIIEMPDTSKKNTPLRDANGKFISKSKQNQVLLPPEKSEEPQEKTEKKGFWGILN